jgi:hypothetical protein
MEQAVVKQVLAACESTGVEASLQVLETTQVEHTQKKRALELALERARYEAERARRQYDAVDPSNRLVAAELEARWNAALTQVSETEERLQTAVNLAGSISENQRKRLLNLGANLSAAWNDPSAPVELKKRILRTVIKEIVVDVNHEAGTIDMKLHWVGGVHTELNVRKNRPGPNGNATSHSVVELVRELAKAQPDAVIAANLNKLGHHTGPGNRWNQNRVRNLRLYNKIPVFDRDCPPEWMTMAKAASLLNVSMALVRTLVTKKILPARQFGNRTPWMIKPQDLDRAEVQNYVKSARGRKAARQEMNHPTLPLL